MVKFGFWSIFWGIYGALVFHSVKRSRLQANISKIMGVRGGLVGAALVLKMRPERLQHIRNDPAAATPWEHRAAKEAARDISAVRKFRHGLWFQIKDRLVRRPKPRLA